MTIWYIFSHLVLIHVRGKTVLDLWIALTFLGSRWGKSPVCSILKMSWISIRIVWLQNNLIRIPSYLHCRTHRVRCDLSHSMKSVFQNDGGSPSWCLNTFVQLKHRCFWRVKKSDLLLDIWKFHRIIKARHLWFFQYVVYLILMFKLVFYLIFWCHF